MTKKGDIWDKFSYFNKDKEEKDKGERKGNSKKEKGKKESKRHTLNYTLW